MGEAGRKGKSSMTGFTSLHSAAPGSPTGPTPGQGLVFIIVVFGLIAVLFYIFGVVLPRLTAPKCPTCRSPLVKEPTDQWRTEDRGTWTRVTQRLVRFKCGACGYKDERWLKSETLARPDTPPDITDTTDLLISDSARRWHDRGRQKQEEADRKLSRQAPPDPSEPPPKS
jgi:hypothetical protein